MQIHEDPVPLRVDASGAVRVGKTRVLYYLVVESFKHGNAPEAIVEMYDALDLADIYAVIGYYLRHKNEVDQFLSDVERSAVEIRSKIEASQPPRDQVRARLESRRAFLEQQRAASGK